jgi:ribosome maturation factor RimP
MTVPDDQRLIYDVIHRTTESLNLELVEFKMAVHKKDVLIQVLADTPQGKIGIEECTLLNRSIVEAIDKEGFFGEDGYSLEVSSPGLDRPLMTYKDFSRNIDAEVRIWLKEKVAGKIEHVGIIKAVTEQSITLLTTTKDKQEITVPIDQVMKGLLVI